MATILWSTTIVAKCQGQLLFVKGFRHDFPDRWYLPGKKDYFNNITPAVAAQRTLYEQTGISARASDFVLHNTLDAHSYPKHIFTIELTLAQCARMRNMNPHVQPKLFDPRFVTEHRKMFGNTNEKTLRVLKLLPKKAPSSSAEQKLGVCDGGHVGAYGNVCTESSCAGSPFRP